MCVCGRGCRGEDAELIKQLIDLVDPLESFRVLHRIRYKAPKTTSHLSFGLTPALLNQLAAVERFPQSLLQSRCC